MITRVVDHWLGHVIGGFVTEFVVNISIIYSEVERRFFKGLRDKYVKYLNT